MCTGNMGGFAITYHIRLLFSQKPVIDLEALIESLRFRCGDIDVISAEAKNIHIGFKEYGYKHQDTIVPAQIVALQPEEFDEDLQEAIGQSWSWREAGEIVESCNYAMLITDLLSAGLDYKDRVRLHSAFLYSLVEHCNCDAIYFYHSKNIINPADFLYNRLESEDFNPLMGFVNVRLFNLEGTGNEMVMDTIGLAALGIPDIQCHFKNLDTNGIAGMLYSYGRYLYDNGDIINDNETVQGINDEKWLCQHETSLVRPQRNVLDINPGLEFSGSR